MNDIKLTAYCLCYNHEKYIRDALEGFVNQQTDFRYRVIVHDDASTDNSQAIIKEYCEKYPELFLPILQTENQYSKNKHFFMDYILPHIEGQYVASCEGDDYWTDPNKLQKQVDFLDAHPEYAGCVHNSRLLDMREHKEELLNTNDKTERDFGLEDVADGVWRKFQTSSLVMRAELAKTLPEYAKVISVGDYPNAIMMALNGGIHYFPDVMSTYRLYSSDAAFSSWNLSYKAAAISLREANAMLECVMQYAPERCHECLRQVIIKNRYTIINLNGHFFDIFQDPELRSVFIKEPVIKKIKDFLRFFLIKLKIKS